MHPAKLTFQALRICLNQEFDEMRRGMAAAQAIMPNGGRLAVLTAWIHFILIQTLQYPSSRTSIR
jgi:16S rRNA (cytosine1402-N4)-methyltransferase